VVRFVIRLMRRLRAAQAGFAPVQARADEHSVLRAGQAVRQGQPPYHRAGLPA